MADKLQVSLGFDPQPEPARRNWKSVATIKRDGQEITEDALISLFRTERGKVMLEGDFFYYETASGDCYWARRTSR